MLISKFLRWHSQNFQVWFRGNVVNANALSQSNPYSPNLGSIDSNKQRPNSSTSCKRSKSWHKTFQCWKRGKPDESYDQGRVLSDFLILKALSISEIEGAVNHFGRLERKLSESLGIWLNSVSIEKLRNTSYSYLVKDLACIVFLSNGELSFSNCQHCFQRRECRRHAACWNRTIRASLSCHGVLHHKEIQTLHKDWKLQPKRWHPHQKPIGFNAWKLSCQPTPTKKTDQLWSTYQLPKNVVSHRLMRWHVHAAHLASWMIRPSQGNQGRVASLGSNVLRNT